MSVGGYPITRIKQTVSSLANQEYKIWYWHLDGSAYDAPMEPLTQEFWQQQLNSRLAYGLVLPAVDVRDKGDLLILVTQNLKHTTNKKFGVLKVRQRYELYSLILEIDFTHVMGMQIMPAPLRIEFFQKFEQIFERYILPKKNEEGKYYRDQEIKEESGLLRPDSQGRMICPKCKKKVAIGDGLVVTDNYPVDDGTILVFAVCEYCEEFVAVSIDAPHTSKGNKSNGK